MLSNIVIATDASEASRAMLGCLDGLRKVGSKEAALVHVFHIRDVGGLYTSLQKLMLPELEKQGQILRGLIVGFSRFFFRMLANLEL